MNERRTPLSQRAAYRAHQDTLSEEERSSLAQAIRKTRRGVKVSLVFAGLFTGILIGRLIWFFV